MSDKIAPPDYDAIEKEAWRSNAKDVPTRLSENDEYILKRINTYTTRFGYDRRSVQEKIYTDEMFATHFTLEPRRQGFHEKTAADWIKKLNGVSNFTILPKSGKNAIHISSDGNIQKNLQNAPSKSLDFEWETGDTKFYAMHKYTKEGGGNQDSQFKEMVDLLSKFLKCNKKDCVLIVIVDGEYYNHSRMEKLKTNTRTHKPKSYAVQIERVPRILEAYK